MLAGMHDIKMVETEVLLCNPHRLARARLVGELELESKPATAVRQHQVEFGASVRTPEVGVAVTTNAENLL